MLIADVLRGKTAGSTLATTAPSATVAELLDLLARFNVGALPVVDDEQQLVGIVSERDVVRQLHERGNDLLGATVGEIMSAEVVTCSPRDRAADLARIMTDRRIRHLPVCKNDRLVGIVSIGDLVKWKISEVEAEADGLKAYIAAS